MNNKKRCLVLGAKGFMGSHLVDALLRQGYRVRAFDRPNVLPLHNESIEHSALEIVDGDFTSDADIAKAIVDCDICFHLISTTLPKSSNADPIFDIETNLMGTVRLLNHAVHKGLRKIIFVSSGGTVYGRPMYLPIDEAHPTNPICSYGITKIAIEKYLALYRELHDLDYLILRLSNPFGERQRVQASQGAIAVFLGKALKGEAVEVWGDGSIVRDYIYISDVVQAMLAGIEYSGDDRVLNIGSGQGVSINEILDGIGAVIGREVSRTYSLARAFDVPTSVLNIDRAKSSLNWSPQVSLLEGLKHTTAWLQADSDNGVS